MKVDWVPLGEVLTMQRTSVDVRVGETHRRIGILSWGKGLLHRDPAIAADMGRMKYFTFPTPSLIFSNIQAWEGAVALTASGDARFVCSSRFYPYVAKSAADVNLRYFLEFFKSEGGLRLMRQASPGTQVRNKTLGRTALEASCVPLPSRSDQDRVAAQLSVLSARLENAERPSAALREQLPMLLGATLRRASPGTTTLRELCANVQIVVHPGDDIRGASAFVGLEHIESHSGRRLGSRALGDESGRKLLFTPGQVTYGYLRPYLNKAWVTDRTGLCSVEQFTLTPAEGVDPHVLSALLRSEAVWLAAQKATNSLQLPRLAIGALMDFRVPDIRGLAWDTVRTTVERLTALVVRQAELERRRAQLRASILPAARNEIFSAMR